MGKSYSNVVVIGADEMDVAAVCRRPAFLARLARIITVFTEGDDSGDAPTEGEISERLACITLNSWVHDSDILGYRVFDRGALITEGVVPDPLEFFGHELSGIDATGVRPDPALLVAALGRGDAAAVASALTDGFVLAEERHEALLTALDLPTIAARFGYRFLDEDDTGYDGPALTRLD